MKGLTYENLVTHYGLSSCSNEPGCLLSRTVHRRGQITHWRGDIFHWDVNRNVTRPGLITFLRVIARERFRGATPWPREVAEGCMWVQEQAQRQWGVKIPPNTFKRDKDYVRDVWYEHKKKRGELSIEDYMSPMYAWAYTQEEAA